MIDAGGRRITAIAVAGGDGKVMCTPCGGCRQRIREFASPDTPILIAGDKGLMASFTLRRYCLKASGLKISIRPEYDIWPSFTFLIRR